MLMYIGRIYEKIIEKEMKYKEKLVKIPVPEFIVLYNGADSYPDYKELHLSDAFMKVKESESAEISLDLKVRVYNINHKRNKNIMEKSVTLVGYSIFIEKIRENKKNLPLEEAIKTAVKYCIENEILGKFFKDNASEVINMLMHEFTIEEITEIRGQEKYEQGIEHEKLIIAKNLLSENTAPEFIRKITGLDLETISALNNSG
jgi:hypothetical protein